MISIVIPTHNRIKYLKNTIPYLLSLPIDIEIIVSDSSHSKQQNDTYLDHPKVKYVKPPAGCSVVDNFNYSYNFCTGNYILFIGDDDIVSPRITEVYQWLLANPDIDAVTFNFPINYYWPDFIHRNSAIKIGGKVNIVKFTGNVKIIDSKAALEDACNKCGSGPLQMPRIYCGIVSKSICDLIVSEHRSLFGGVSPDIYSSCLLSHFATKAVSIDFPIVIPGLSGKSTSGKSASGQHTTKLMENDHLKPFKNLVWDPLIPKFYSVQTVWGFSLLSAAEKLRIPKSNINIELLYLRTLIRNPRYIKFVLSSFKQRILDIGFLLFLKRFFNNMTPELLLTYEMLRNRRRKFSDTDKNYVGVFGDIAQAVEYIHNATLNKKINFR